MTPAEYLAFLYPRFFEEGGPSFQDEEARNRALAMADARRPTCLSEDRQNEAVAHYAAFLLDGRLRDLQAGPGGSGVSVLAGPITSEREGDIQRTYADGGGNSADLETGPTTPFARYRALARLCGRGAIMTRFG